MGTFGKRKGGQRVSQVAPVVKNLPANAGDVRCSFNPWVRKIPEGRNGSGLVFLPGESHGQRSLGGYSPWGRRVGHACRDLAHREGRGTQSLLEKQKQDPAYQLGHQS